MSKALFKEIAKKSGVSEADVTKVIGELVTSITGIEEGKKVKVEGFGTFKKVSKSPRTAKNPKTGESVEVPGKVVIAFKDSNPVIK